MDSNYQQGTSDFHQNQEGFSFSFTMEKMSSLDQANKCSTSRCTKTKENLEEVEKSSTAPNNEEHEVWNNAHLLLVCMFLTVVLLLILEGCRLPSEPWVLFGYGKILPWDWRALWIVVAFTALQGVLYYLPFGKVVKGKVGHDGRCIKYSMNGLHALSVTLLLLAVLWQYGVLQASMVSSQVPQLLTACTTVSLLLSVGLYLRSFWSGPQQLVNYGERGNMLQAFALGRERDPSIGRIDLKQFAMVRIGFIGWAMVDLCYLLTEIEVRGWPSLPLLLVVIFQLTYILDFLIDEESVLPTKEYTEDGIGFLMILGEYIWIPFYSSVPVYFLLNRPAHLNPLATVLICLIFTIGFVVYYLSNDQKDGFRKNPDDPAFAHLKTLSSPLGKKLLVSGWFGWVRHPNYLGDILMTFAWCLPCGFSSFLPYLPALQCANLLRLRAAEIEKACSKKHGEAWQEYCCHVPYKLVPYVY